MAKRFNDGFVDAEPGGAGSPHEGLLHWCGGGFRDFVAGFADEEGGAVRVAGCGAGDEGVKPLDFVRKPVFDEEIQGAVGNGRLRA